MQKQIRMMVIFTGIWFIASLVNGLLSGTSIVILDSRLLLNAIPNFILSACFSFVCGVPLVGFVWFVAMIAQLNGKKGDPLFRLILSTGFMCSLAGALWFINALGGEFKEARYVVGLCIVISGLMGILVFRKQLKTIE